MSFLRRVDNSEHHIVIAQGGGSSPAIAAVIEALVLEAKRWYPGARITGVHNGVRDLSHESRVLETVDLTSENVWGRGQAGLSILRSNRASAVEKKNPGAATRVCRRLSELGATAFWFIGGNDSGSSCAAVAKEAGSAFRVGHAPKTIDGDLWFPDKKGTTFGLDSAALAARYRIEHLYREERTEPYRWFLEEEMGRDVGKLLIETMKACWRAHCTPPIFVIPEMFPNEVSFDNLVRLVVGAMVKSRLHGITGGTILMSEGIPYRLSGDSLRDVPKDEHGHPRLSEVSVLSQVASAVSAMLEEIGFVNNVGTRIKVAHEKVGYGEARVGKPSEFDLQYARSIALPVLEKLTSQSGPDGTVYYTTDGRVEFAPFGVTVPSGHEEMRTIEVEPEEIAEVAELIGHWPFLESADFDSDLAELSRQCTKLDEGTFRSTFESVADLVENQLVTS